MSIFPIIDPAAEQTGGDQSLPLYREVAWDYDRDVPVFRRGEPVTVSGAEALKVWIWKALRTPRYRHEIYSWAYGSEFEGLIGQAYTDALKSAEAPRYLRECLLVNPYITQIKNVSVGFEEDVLSVSGLAQSIYGEVEFRAAI